MSLVLTDPIAASELRGPQGLSESFSLCGAAGVAEEAKGRCMRHQESTAPLSYEAVPVRVRNSWKE